MNDNNIYDFKSLKEVMDFQSSYTSIRQQLIAYHEHLIDEEKKLLKIDLQQLESTIPMQKQQTEKLLADEISELKRQFDVKRANKPVNFFKKIIWKLRLKKCERQVKQKEENFDIEVMMRMSELVGINNFKKSRNHFITSHLSDAVKQSAQNVLKELERKKSIIDELNTFIYGALGEQKVVKALEILSDEYFLINDFKVSFSPAIYNRQENEYVKSIQIDHILVAPSGIFLIETKNWSDKSLENLSLRSPVDQIKRTSFALFTLLNNQVGNYNLRLDRHHWGDRKISIKNLIVLINAKPKEEFQYVKILTLNELLGYVNHFKPIFSKYETQSLADFLLKVNKAD